MNDCNMLICCKVLQGDVCKDAAYLLLYLVPDRVDGAGDIPLAFSGFQYATVGDNRTFYRFYNLEQRYLFRWGSQQKTSTSTTE